MSTVYMASKRTGSFYINYSSIDWTSLKEVAGGYGCSLGAYSGTKEKMFVAKVDDLRDFIIGSTSKVIVLTYGDGQMKVTTRSDFNRIDTVWTLFYYKQYEVLVEDVVHKKINYNFETGLAETLEIDEVVRLGNWR